jgi:hypothetical protein
MSPKHRLIVRAADPTAEITVRDGRFNRVGSAVGIYEGEHADGLYQVRVRTSGAVEEELVSLDHSQTVNFKPVAFATPVPLAQTKGGEPGDRDVVVAASRQPLKKGQGGGVLISVRVSKGSEPGRAGAEGSPARGLHLCDADGRPVLDVEAATAAQASQGPGAVAVCLEVDPGTYRLRFKDSSEETRERSLIVSPGWTTQCFLVRRVGRPGRSIDLEQGVVSMQRLGEVFQPDDRLARVRDAAIDALANSRKITDAVVTQLENDKFSDPMLGLLAAHLLLRDQPSHSHLSQIVLNVARMLGHTHPDVQALRMRRSRGRKLSVRDMPMLRASWNLIVTRSIDNPELLVPGSPASRLAVGVAPTWPWLVWDASETSAAPRELAKMAALEGYFRSAEPTQEGVAFSIRPAGGQGTVEPPDRAALARSLGVPSGVLNDMLSRLGRS